MSDSTASRRGDSARSGKIWLGLAIVAFAAIALAWLGTAWLRGETTDSGLYFRTVQEGSGAQIQAVDGVLIEYEGRLADGTVFDSSEGRGPTPMIAGQVIPGFAQALTMMQKGGRYRIRIPSELAYGASPPPGSPIPPDADLTFDVEVVEVVPNAALMMGGAGQGIPGQPGPGQGAPGDPQAPAADEGAPQRP